MMRKSAVTHGMVAGALFDFAAYLTGLPTEMTIGANASSVHVLEHLKTWAALRGLDLTDPLVKDWPEWLSRGGVL